MKIQIVTNRASKSAMFNGYEEVEAAGFELEPPAQYEASILRQELRGQKQIKNLCGPMWGGYCRFSGEPILRFEDWPSYERLSR